MIEPPVYTILSVDPAVTALVPKTRIKGSGYAGASPQAPYITWQMVSGVPHNYVADRPSGDSFRAQIDIWDTDSTRLRQIAEKVRDALEPHAQCVLTIGARREDDTDLYRFQMDWSFTTPR